MPQYYNSVYLTDEQEAAVSGLLIAAFVRQMGFTYGKVQPIDSAETAESVFRIIPDIATAFYDVVDNAQWGTLTGIAQFMPTYTQLRRLGLTRRENKAIYAFEKAVLQEVTEVAKGFQVRVSERDD